MADNAFQGNVVILTGASLGIGEGLAYELAGRSAKLALAARSADKLQEVAGRCVELGGEALVVPTDITDEAACEALVAATVERFGHVDTLINNAGISMWARFDELEDLSIARDVIEVNVLGTMNVTYYALPHLKQSQGRIATVSSLAGKTGVPTRTAYSASKFALAGFSEALRVELMDTGVTVTVIYPGFVASGLHERIKGPDGVPLGEDHPVDYSTAMSVETCARITADAIAARKREEIMTLRGKLGQWIKLIAPGMIDNIARQAIATGR